MSKKNLLTDDDSDDRELFSEAIAEVAPHVSFETSEDGDETMDRLKQSSKLPDLIFMDINLPTTSGWDCLKQIKDNSRLREIQVIIYSTSSHSRDLAIAAELGALCFITKPHTFRDMKHILKTVVTCLDGAQLHLLRNHPDITAQAKQ